ncbi:MAG: hypothetical protein QG594_2345 [Bacteroidota bacterium]|nr:hypothetical protein [Bacteroidota bacterium]
MQTQGENNYLQAVQQIKTAILKSRYEAAALVNTELLKLYFGIGQYVSFHSRNKNWGKGAIDSISNLLQQELHGLRGFSASNIKNMRTFYEEWEFMKPFLIDEKAPLFQFSDEELNRQLPTTELKNVNCQLPTDDLKTNFLIQQLPTAELENEWVELFLKVPFTQQRFSASASVTLVPTNKGSVFT